MSKVLASAKQVLAVVLPLLAPLKQPGVATAAVGYLTPIVLGLFGNNFNAAVLVPYVVAVGGLAATLERVLPGGLLHPSPSPTPPAPPAK